MTNSKLKDECVERLIKSISLNERDLDRALMRCAMVELQEHRKASGEPVADVVAHDKQRQTVRRSAEHKAQLSAASTMLAEKLTDERLANFLAVSENLGFFDATTGEFESMVVELVALRKAKGGVIAWIHEDELPDSYPYDEMFPFSKVDVVRMFPVYAPLQTTAPQSVSESLYKIANHIASAKNGLPQEWQDWAEEIEADIRRAQGLI